MATIVRNWVRLMRRFLLPLTASLCLAAGVLLLYAGMDSQQVMETGTPEMAGLLGLILLPGATMAARRIDRRFRAESRLRMSSR